MLNPWSHILGETQLKYNTKDMVPLFGRNPTEVCLIFTLDFIYLRHHHRLELRNLNFLPPPCWYADAVAGKGVTLYNCFDFVDGIIARICRPTLNERVVYTPTQGYMV